MPRIVKLTAKTIEQAAEALRRGDVVAFPTETVYGLGADTFNENALRMVYDLKGRPKDNPLIAHVLDANQARAVTDHWDERCESLAARFWPGPLTLVVGKAPNVPAQATAGYGTIAVRSPAHRAARDLLAAFGGPISAPSANRSGHVSPTSAQHVASDFAEISELLILDGGTCQLGIESTVLDMTRSPMAVLRPGSIGIDELAATLGETVDAHDSQQQAASPGTALSHYAPRTPLILLESPQLASKLETLDERAIVLGIHCPTVNPPHTIIVMPQAAEQYAAQLYDALRRADAMGGSRIVVELPTETGAVWDAIRNRLRRAAH